MSAPSEAPRTLRVAVDLPGAAGERLYDYLPLDDAKPLVPGDGVVVPFGGRRAVGVVVAVDGSAPSGVSLKRIEARLGETPLLGPLAWSLSVAVATRWGAPIAATIRSLLPPGLLDKVELSVRRVGAATPDTDAIGISDEWVGVERLPGARGAGRDALLATLRRLERDGGAERRWRLVAGTGRAIEETHAAAIPGVERPARLGARQEAALAALEAAAAGGDGFIATTLLPGGLPVARRLAERGLARLEVRRRERRHADRRVALNATESPIAWSASQEDLLRAVARGEGVTLLDGAPGSGKSRVAAEAARRTFEAGGSVLWLVPEMAQAALAADLLDGVVNAPVEVLHSGLSAGERYDARDRLRAKGPHLVVGTRLALAALETEIGLVVVDEEHEGAYKADRSPRLQARDAAGILARLAGAPLLLISATPSIESLARAESEGWSRVTLAPRGASPRVEVVDLRAELRDGWRGMISRPLLALLESIEWTSGAQALLIINRRGLASAILCRDCGAAQACPSCERPLVLHSAGSLLRCHGCGLVAAPLDRCPSCGGARLRAIGGGTQRLETEVRRLFPTVSVDRLDADAAAPIGATERILDAFRSGKTQLLIGTALAAKALDLPRLALVGVVSADAGLLLPDERAAERVVALVVQAAGRLGRGAEAGAAVIQTYRPEDPAIVAAIAAARGESPLAWREREIALRRAAGGAPFLRTAKLTIAAPTAIGAERRAKELAERLRAALAADPSRAASRLLGPIPAWVPRRAGQWRQNVILRDREPLELIGTLAARDLTIDLDPETLL